MSVFPAFSGSYQPHEIHFLLKPMQIEMIPVEEKEFLIQSGLKHYSEMLSEEPPPTQRHLEIFHRALDLGGKRLAIEGVQLAKAIVEKIDVRPIVLLSIVRAGVPLGVILHQTLHELGIESIHYGISIIRDKGIDEIALNYVETLHGTAGVIFVDGWTGKGAISMELNKALLKRPGYSTEVPLVVLADPCGSAWLSASADDWLIPFGIIGAPVSGMISRSIWVPNDMHGCVECQHLAGYECSQLLINTVKKHRLNLNILSIASSHNNIDKKKRWLASQKIIKNISQQYKVNSLNRIKPGIAEATRAILRRVPDQVLIQSRQDQDISLLLNLAEAKGVHVTEVGNCIAPYRAISIIKKVL